MHHVEVETMLLSFHQTLRNHEIVCVSHDAGMHHNRK